MQEHQQMMLPIAENLFFVISIYLLIQINMIYEKKAAHVGDWYLILDTSVLLLLLLLLPSSILRDSPCGWDN